MTRRKHASARGRAKRFADEDQTRAAPDNGRLSISHQAPLLERMAHDPKAPSLSSRTLRGIQVTRGNRYVQRMFKRTPEAQDQHTRALGPAGAVIASGAPTAYVQRSNGSAGLQAPRFAGDPVLGACYDGEEALRVGDSGPAVKKIQEALIELAFPLPKYGADAKFGSEMKRALRRFQGTYRLTGPEVTQSIVGQQTMALLDGLFGRAGRAGHPAAPRDGVFFNGSRLIVYREGKEVDSVAALSGFSGKEEWQKGEGPIPDGRYAISPHITRPPVTKRQNTFLGAYAIESGYQELTATDLLVCPDPSIREGTVPCPTPRNPRRRCFQVSVVDLWGRHRIKIQGSAVLGKPGGGTVTRSGFYIHGGLPERSWTTGCVKVLDESIFKTLVDFKHPVELVVKKGGP